MKKQHNLIRKALAMALCLCMALSLLPTAVFATENTTPPAGQTDSQLGVPPTDSPDASGESDTPLTTDPEISEFSSSVPEDGAVADVWAQDAQTVKESAGICEAREGKLYLKTGSGNTNNGDQFRDGKGPAVFLSAEMNQALAPVDNVYTVNFKVTPLVDEFCFGVYVNYKNPGAGMFIGHNNPGGNWFWQAYAAAGNDPYAAVGNPQLLKGETYAIAVSWNAAAKTASLSVNGTPVVTDQSYSNVADHGEIGSINNFAIKMGKSGTGVLAEAYISDLHYTGQASLTAYDVAGKVTNDATGGAISGATVTVGGKTATTNAQGEYTVTGLLPGDYTLSAAAEGYWSPAAQDVTVASADLSGKNIALAPHVFNTVSGTVTAKEGGAPLAGAQVSAAGQKALTGVDGAYTLPSVLGGEQTLTISLDDYADWTGSITVAKTANTPLTGQNAALVYDPSAAVLSTPDMNVRVDLSFPRVIKYTMKGDLAGKVMDGQTETLDTITINGVDLVPTVQSAVDPNGRKITYTMTAKAADIDCVVHAELVAEGKTLAFNITGIDNNLDEIAYPVERISIPNHSLISVRDDQAGANLMANRLASSTITSGDFRYSADQFASANNQRFIYAFLSNSELSAGMSSNSEWGAKGAGSDNHRVLVNTENRDGHMSLGLSSSEWYYDRKVSSSDSNAMQNAVIARKDSVMGPTELPLYAKVVVTGDENGDETVNWQDGALAARDTIVHIPFKGSEVPNLVTTRIAMNFGSQAQNPFLTTLDNVKRVALNTDGLGQSILLKGYGSEGHDSGHPDYADIGVRMGGAADMNTMMEEGADYGARFGIHINASEFYPEAKAFENKMIRRDDDGGLHYGWNWLDQGVGINGLYDLASGSRAARLGALKDKVGDNMDFVYVDVWGNNTSGSEDAWQTRKLSQMLTNNGWRVAHEWAWANEWEVTFQHWVADYGYGNYGDKGKYNSTVERFLFNDTRDSFAADFPHYGGYANAPLLGGCVTQGFEGWQGDGEYDQSIESIFEHMIPNKFLQHYQITRWEDSAAPVTMMWYTDSGSSRERSRWGDKSTVGNVYMDPNNCYAWNDNTGAYAVDDNGNPSQTGGQTTWTPEVQVALQSGDGEDTIVITRGSDGVVNDSYAYDVGGEEHVEGNLADKREYRARHITMNGKVILKGTPAPAAGETSDVVTLRGLADQQYLIPWLWDTEGGRLAANDQKLYHRNDVGGESTWDLPDGWENLVTVKMYQLTDNGRAGETVVNVVGGKVTLNSEAKANYVIVKGENGAQAPTVVWSTGMHLKDVGFNAAAIEDNWNVSGKGTALRHVNDDQQSVLKLGGEVAVSQTMTDLKPGQRYVTYVAVDNRSDAKAAVAVDVDGAVIASNYTLRSIANNYISAYSLSNNHPIEEGAAKFQNMYIFFTAPQSGKVTLTLSRAAGAGNTYFDDVRTLETQAQNLTLDGEGNVTKFTQDFEHVAQGQYPFVVGPVENVTDNRQHLSENHAPYTQAGWDVKKMDDVLEGSWALKINGLTQKNSLVYQTIPQNFRFEPGVTYTVTFDYQMGSAGTYQAVYGTGAYSGMSGLTAVPLEKSLGTTATCKFTIVGDPSGQSWFGIYSTGTAPAYPNEDLSDNEQNFGGYKDFVLDNVVIERSAAQKGELAALVATASGMSESDYTGDWAAMTTALAAAKQVMANQKATQAQIDAAKTALDTAMKALTKKVTAVAGTITLADGPVAGATVTLEDADYMPIISVVTGADGRYSFTDLSVKDYKLKVTAPGCAVQTVDVTGLTTGTTGTKDVTLAAQPAAPYVNTFDGGDVSMIQGAAGDSTVSVTAIRQNGSGAAKISFTGSDRQYNNAVDKSIQMTDGTFSCDVTLIGEGKRFGMNLRDTGGNNRVYIGQFDAETSWGWEHWSSPNAYGNGTGTVKMANGVTRHMEATIAGNVVTLKVDGVTVVNGMTLTGTPPTGAGYVGFDSNWEREIIIDNLRIAPADAPVANTYTIAGAVKDSEGKAIAAASVIVKRGADVVSRTGTGLDGGYITLALAAGDYTVQVTAPGYAAGTKAVTVSNANIADANLALTLDVGGLEALYDEYKALTQGAYTDESWQALQAALAAAKTAIDNPTASGVVAAHSGLTAAIGALTEKPVDKSLLRAYYNSFNAYVSSGYTADSWTAFQTALKAAAAVLKDTTAKQPQVDAACAALVSAEKALVSTGGSTGGGGGGGGGSNTSTVTTKNPDGSTTVTVTNKSTGTVTETTTTTDGTKAVTETKKDGTTTSVVTLSGKAEGTVTLPIQPVTAGAGTVTVKTDKTTAVIIPIRDAKPGVVAVLVKADGTEEIARKSVTNQDGVALTLDGSATLKLVDNSKDFADVANSHWAAEAVRYATSRELFQGTGDDAFSPALPMTRSMLAAVLYRLENEPEAKAAGFYDVSVDAWYAAAVGWASEKGIVTGTGNGFQPDGNLTRESLAVMLYRYAKQSGGDAPTEGMAVKEFADAASISDWASDAMSWAVGAGIITGKDGDKLDPAGPASRAEVATMLMRLVNALNVK